MRAGTDSKQPKPSNEPAHQREATGDQPLVGPCPYLGMAEDPATSFAFPTPANHCFSRRSPSSIEVHHQETFCLTGQYTTCPLFQEAASGIPESQPAPRQLRHSLPALLSKNVRTLFTASPAGARLRTIFNTRSLAVVTSIVLLVMLFYFGRDSLGALSAAINGGDGAAGNLTAEAPTATRPIVVLSDNVTSSPTIAPPTASPTSSPTARPSATRTPALIATPSSTPDVTVTSEIEPTATATPTPEATSCGPPPGWVSYIVQPGENLFRISLRYNISMALLIEANCLTSSNVFAGQSLFVPFQAPPSTSTANPVPAPTETIAPAETVPPQPSATPVPPTHTPPPSATDIPQPSATPPVIDTPIPPPTATPPLPVSTQSPSTVPHDATLP